MGILKLVREKGPITGDEIARHFNLTRATLRPDLAILTMAGVLEARPRVGYYCPEAPNRSFLTEQLENMPVKRVKAMPVVLEAGKSVYEAVVSLFLEDKSTLFVVNRDGGLEGVVTSKDLLRAAMGQADLTSQPVEMVMTRFPQVVWVDENAPVLAALDKMSEAQVACLPVLRDGRIPVGRFDLGIVLQLFGELTRGYFEEGAGNDQ